MQNNLQCHKIIKKVKKRFHNLINSRKGQARVEDWVLIKCDFKLFCNDLFFFFHLNSKIIASSKEQMKSAIKRKLNDNEKYSLEVCLFIVIRGSLQTQTYRETKDVANSNELKIINKKNYNSHTHKSVQRLWIMMSGKSIPVEDLDLLDIFCTNSVASEKAFCS